VDVETAFLNGRVLSEVYVKQPIGYENGTDKVYKLN
jgi:Reverse transcriptase (RNA-dependent DNA polymerase).